jgi:hypothetical protein
MKLTVIALGVYSDEWPEIEVWVNSTCHGHAQIKGQSEIDFDISLPENRNYVRLEYVNKKEYHTKAVNGSIIADQTLTLEQIRIDDILCDSWMLTDGHYEPRYFEGFLAASPEAAACLPSQLIWHFPGKFLLPVLPAEEEFWSWYRDQRYAHMQQYQGKDWHRQEKYIGSRDMHQDLISQIKQLIDV